MYRYNFLDSYLYFNIRGLEPRQKTSKGENEKAFLIK